MVKELKRKPLSSPVSVKAGMEGMRIYGGKDLRNKEKVLLSLEWKRVGVMDNDSGDDEPRELG